MAATLSMTVLSLALGFCFGFLWLNGESGHSVSVECPELTTKGSCEHFRLFYPTIIQYAEIYILAHIYYSSAILYIEYENL